MEVKLTIDDVSKTIPMEEASKLLNDLLEERKLNTFLDVMLSIHEFQEDLDDDDFWDVIEDCELEFMSIIIRESYIVSAPCE